MSAELDAAYRSQRLRLASTVSAQAARLWAQSLRERDRTIERVLPLVSAGQRRTVALVDAYMASKMRRALGSGEPKGLNPERYTIERLRGRAAEEVYERPFGAVGSFLEREQGMERAAKAGADSLTRLIRTDLQLAQTHAAQDWMVEDDRVTYYNRVLGAGENCNLCIAAANRRYYREDLAPIHERCGCSVAPAFDPPGSLTRAASFRESDVQVTPDSELGPRLIEPGWAG